MVLFTVLAIVLVTLIITFVVAVGVFGSSVIIVFADVFVCMAILIFIIKKLRKK